MSMWIDYGMFRFCRLINDNEYMNGLEAMWHSLTHKACIKINNKVKFIINLLQSVKFRKLTKGTKVSKLKKKKNQKNVKRV